MIDRLKARLKQLAERIDALSVRERGLVFFAVMAVLYLIAYNVVFGPLRSEQARLERELKTRREQVQAANQQLEALFSGDGAGGENRAKVAALTRQLAELDAQMDKMTAGVVTPKEMAKLVEQMLTHNKNLELIKLEALAPTVVGDDAKPAAARPAPGTAVYRHGMRIELKGRYFDIVEYLKALERLPWKVFWGEVSFETDKYPLSKVNLVIYTLSRDPGWIGV